MSRLDDILNMSAVRRRKVNLRKSRGKYNRQGRKKRSREELVKFLKDNKLKSVRQLEAFRTDSDPNAYDYQKEFGNWMQARISAFGPPLSKIGKFDAAYMAKAVIEFDLWTRREYHSKRMIRPDVLPSLHFVYREWGTFGQLTEYARQVSIRHVLDSYLAFWRRLGRVPTLMECKEEGIVLDTPVKYFGSKREMDKLLSELDI